MNLKRLLIAGFAAGAALVTFAGETVLNMEITPEKVKTYNRYNFKATCETIDGKPVIHLVGKSVVWIDFDVAKIAGKKVKLSFKAKFANISETPTEKVPLSTWGCKALCYGYTAEKKYWGIQAGPRRGTSDWMEISNKLDTPAPVLANGHVEINIPDGEAWIESMTVETID